MKLNFLKKEQEQNTGKLSKKVLGISIGAAAATIIITISCCILIFGNNTEKTEDSDKVIKITEEQKAEHDLNPVYEEILPTCIQKGIRIYTCNDCSGVYEEYFGEFSEHIFALTSKKEATCSEEGESVETCEICKETRTESIPKTEHNFSAGQIISQANCNSEGIREFVCEKCGEKKEESIPKTDHIYETVSETKAGCISEGKRIIKCRICQDTYAETSKPIGHSWKDATCLEAKTCENCGLTEGKKLKHNIKNGDCLSCGETILLADKCELKIEQKFPLYVKAIDGSIIEIQKPPEYLFGDTRNEFRQCAPTDLFLTIPSVTMYHNKPQYDHIPKNYDFVAAIITPSNERVECKFIYSTNGRDYQHLFPTLMHIFEEGTYYLEFPTACEPE